MEKHFNFEIYDLRHESELPVSTAAAAVIGLPFIHLSLLEGGAKKEGGREGCFASKHETDFVQIPENDACHFKEMPRHVQSLEFTNNDWERLIRLSRRPLLAHSSEAAELKEWVRYDPDRQQSYDMFIANFVITFSHL